MKILYGCQGTGSGHISRARAMAKELKKAGHEVQYLFSGRPCVSDYYDMEIFGDAWYRKGLTFSVNNGKVNLLKTLFKNDYSNFLKDIDHLCLDQFDLIISDYEPITSYAAKCQGRFCIGIGHQYAFDFKIPKDKNNFITDLVMKNFAPVSLGVGLHWDSFGQNILPPIVEVPESKEIIQRKVLVYLAFENPNDILNLLSKFPEFEFIVYGFKYLTGSQNVHFKNPSREGFLEDLVDSEYVICNAGFELVSEALHLGKKILVKPLQNQMEQHSNAKALAQLGYGIAVEELNFDHINDFLTTSENAHVSYPNVAAYIVENIINANSFISIESEPIWNKVRIIRH